MNRHFLIRQGARLAKRAPAYLTQSAHVEGLDLEILLDAVFGALAANAGLLHAAERSDLHRHHAGIKANHAEFELLRDAPGATHIARKEIGGKAIGRRVRDCNCLVFVAETK